jgi:hypothetical protein
MLETGSSLAINSICSPPNAILKIGSDRPSATQRWMI